ncbi:MAG: addiction module protein, partial [Planctomycetaceae bacterium]
MSTQLSEITDRALSLPVSERLRLAQKLWESLDIEQASETANRDALTEAQRRDAELSSGQVEGRTHEEVMEA